MATATTIDYNNWLQTAPGHIMNPRETQKAKMSSSCRESNLKKLCFLFMVNPLNSHMLQSERIIN